MVLHVKRALQHDGAQLLAVTLPATGCQPRRTGITGNVTNEG